ncbi:MAG: hypothetical protein DCC49_01135 [Acidobacteria bacterium]|nr:MAG: hypothetical protein DCC49_01135 [Acidobacteriota bacterium]
MVDTPDGIECGTCGYRSPSTAKWCFQCHTSFEQSAPVTPPVTFQPEPGYAQPHQFAPQPYPPVQPGPPPVGAFPPVKPDAPGATGALVFGIISVVAWIACGFPGLVGLGGVILGISARNKIKESRGSLGGEGKAAAGIALGSIGIVLGLLVGILFISAAIRGREAASPESISRDQKASSYPFTVRDGNFQFQVIEIDCSASRCDASMNVTKIAGSNAEETLYASNQKLIDTNGVRSEGYMTGGGDRSIASGVETPVIISFTISSGAQPRSIELHDSMFSDGVTVLLPEAGT